MFYIPLESTTLPPSISQIIFRVHCVRRFLIAFKQYTVWYTGRKYDKKRSQYFGVVKDVFLKHCTIQSFRVKTKIYFGKSGLKQSTLIFDK